MNNHPHSNDPAVIPSSIRIDLPDMSAARPLRQWAARPAAALAGGAILALAVSVAPVPVFSMPAVGGTVARPMQAESPAASASPAAGDQKTTASFDAAQVADLRGHLGEFVEIKGTPTGTGANKSGQVLYLNFSRRRGAALTVVFFLPKGSATPSGGSGTRPASVEDLKQFVGKNVTIKGQLSDHQGDVQMVVPYLEQIKIQETPPSSGK